MAVLSSNDERREVLTNKRKCKDLPDWSKVYIDRYKTTSELTLIHNCKTLIKLSGAKDYRVAGSGRVVKVGDNRDRHGVNNEHATSQAAAPETDGPTGAAPHNTPDGAEASAQEELTSDAAATTSTTAATAPSSDGGTKPSQENNPPRNAGAAPPGETGAKQNNKSVARKGLTTPSVPGDSAADDIPPRRSGRAGGGKQK